MFKVATKSAKPYYICKKRLTNYFYLKKKVCPDIQNNYQERLFKMSHAVPSQALVLCAYCSTEVKRKIWKSTLRKNMDHSFLSTHFGVKRKHKDNKESGEKWFNKQTVLFSASYNVGVLPQNSWFWERIFFLLL